MDGTEIDRAMFNNVTLTAGRTITEIGLWKPDLPSDEYCVFEYMVKQEHEGHTKIIHQKAALD